MQPTKDQLEEIENDLTIVEHSSRKLVTKYLLSCTSVEEIDEFMALVDEIAERYKPKSSNDFNKVSMSFMAMSQFISEQLLKSLKDIKNAPEKY